MENLSIREASRQDLPFVREMLFEAFFWRPGPAIDDFDNPEFAKLLAGWGRRGDCALIAEIGGEQVGAAWYRLWSEAEHSYGYVDAETPELGMAVKSEFRGRGFGRELLRALLARASRGGYLAISLSVEPDNFSRKLYETEGFVKVGEGGSAWTMKKTF